MENCLHKKRLHQNGFSLIEILVYIAILVIVSGGALTMLFSLTDQINTGRAERIVRSSAEVTLERMLGDIRAADTIDTFYSTLETSPGALTLLDGATTTDYAVVGGVIEVTEDGSVVGPLTDDRVTVDSLIFYHYDNTFTEMVRTVLTLSATVGDATVTRTFEAAAVLRGSYE